MLEFEKIEEFLEIIRKEFGRKDNKSRKVAELKELEQESKIMEEFVQKFRRAVRRSEYMERPLVEEFKREINRRI